MRLSTTALGVLLMAGSPGLALAAGGTATAGSATTVQATMMTDAQVQQKLQSEGYTNVQVTKHDKGHIDVMATKNGKAEKLAVNPQTGAVMPDAENDKDSD
jgi:predicted aspartyl protease